MSLTGAAPEESLTPGQLAQRALRPSLRVTACQVMRLPEKSSSPALGSSLCLPQGDRPRPWQESDSHHAGLLVRRPLVPSVGGFLAQDRSSAGGGRMRAVSATGGDRVS